MQNRWIHIATRTVDYYIRQNCLRYIALYKEKKIIGIYSRDQLYIYDVVHVPKLKCARKLSNSLYIFPENMACFLYFSKQDAFAPNMYVKPIKATKVRDLFEGKTAFSIPDIKYFLLYADPDQIAVVNLKRNKCIVSGVQSSVRLPEDAALPADGIQLGRYIIRLKHVLAISTSKFANHTFLTLSGDVQFYLDRSYINSLLEHGDFVCIEGKWVRHFVRKDRLFFASSEYGIKGLEIKGKVINMDLVEAIAVAHNTHGLCNVVFFGNGFSDQMVMQDGFYGLDGFEAEVILSHILKDAEVVD